VQAIPGICNSFGPASPSKTFVAFKLNSGKYTKDSGLFLVILKKAGAVKTTDKRLTFLCSFSFIYKTVF
jgi:hypothetical protein